MCMCLFLITNEFMNFPIPILLLVGAESRGKPGDSIFFQFGCANTATTTANKCAASANNAPLWLLCHESCWGVGDRELGGGQGTRCVLSAAVKRKVQQAAPLNQQSENRKMPIRVGGATVAPGSQVTRIVSIRLGDRRERERGKERHTS